MSNVFISYRRTDNAYAWHDLLGTLLLRAQSGTVDVASMKHALERMKATGAGLPGLGDAHINDIEGMVEDFSHAAAARPDARTT